MKYNAAFLQLALVMTAGCTISDSAMACAQGPAPSADRKVALVRLKAQFDRLKAARKAAAEAKKQDDTPTPPTIVGTWISNVLIDGEVVDSGFEQWHPDGTHILNDAAPPISGAVCIGMWEKTGDLTYELKHPTWFFDESGLTLVGLGYILEKVKVEPSGNSYTGTVTVEGYDLDGNHTFHSEANLAGERMTMEPPPNAGPIPNMRMPWPGAKTR